MGTRVIPQNKNHTQTDAAYVVKDNLQIQKPFDSLEYQEIEFVTEKILKLFYFSSPPQVCYWLHYIEVQVSIDLRNFKSKSHTKSNLRHS